MSLLITTFLNHIFKLVLFFQGWMGQFEPDQYFEYEL